MDRNRASDPARDLCGGRRRYLNASRRERRATTRAASDIGRDAVANHIHAAARPGSYSVRSLEPAERVLLKTEHQRPFRDRRPTIAEALFDCVTTDKAFQLCRRVHCIVAR
jgi:hypothetical protein